MTEIEKLDLVFDTFAWIEELGDGPYGEKVHALHVTRSVGTPLPVIAEIANTYDMRAPQARERALEIVLSTSIVLPLTEEIAIAAGRTRARLSATRKGIGLIDCLVLETARAAGAALVTGDPHLKGLEGVEFLS